VHGGRLGGADLYFHWDMEHDDQPVHHVEPGEQLL
jgi:hypothetical protein